MPLVAGVATSHSPAVMEPVERWGLIYSAIPEDMKNAQPVSASRETDEIMASYRERIDAALAELGRVIGASHLDAVIVVGDDAGDMFDRGNIPCLAVFTGEEMWGLSGTSYTPRDLRRRVYYKCDSELARWLLEGLVRRGFDVANCAEFAPRGPRGGGIGHMVTHVMPAILGGESCAMVPFFIDEYDPPLPSAARCVALGRAMSEVLGEYPGRVGVVASGGLSHDPNGPRAGWIDEPLDRWFLERLARNEIDELQHLFTFDSASLQGGTGELRAWIVAGAAINRPARVVDYVPVHHAKTGLAFVAWDVVHG